jgi:hypothetical protein
METKYVVNITTNYSGLTSLITGSSLSVGSYYLITDFKTCYDVPEYYVDGDNKPSEVIDYRQGNVEPLIVQAISSNTISSTAYQPAYPNDTIKYDWTWNTTEITGGEAYGRITERVDEYNNRTDYDHRNILFNRFQSYDKEIKLTGTIYALESSPDDTLVGVGTYFSSEVNPGDILIIDKDGTEFGVKVVSAITDTQLTIVVDPTFTDSFCGTSYSFYNALGTGNYDEYKEVYIGQKNEEDWNSFLTFNLDGTALHNYIGDYSRFYLEDNVSNSSFLLANNVFYSDNSGIYSNTIGDRSYNNTGRYWFLRNTIAGRFYNNTIYNNGFYSNNIGEYFNDNVIRESFWGNTIGEDFYQNLIYNQFFDNQIGSEFNSNKIYFNFYENSIGVHFENNNIGHYSDINSSVDGNDGQLRFWRNSIGNNFESNTIRRDFQNNQIANKLNENIFNGDFYKNVIGNGFNGNQNIGYDVYGNHIGDGFNNNELIGDDFYDNQIGNYFNSNSISYKFNNNQIGNTVENNTLGDTQYFNWDSVAVENLTARTYNTFYNSLDGNVGQFILGKELIMHFQHDSGTTLSSGNLVIGETYEIADYQSDDDFSNIADVISGVINTNGCIFTATGTEPTTWSFGSVLTELTSYDEYYTVKFTQWTQGYQEYSNGGGFSYERTKVYPSIGSTVYFTKSNYTSQVDVIIPGRLEIKRGNNGGIFNVVLESNWNSSTSPAETEWNSIYTQPYNGNGFEFNTIVNEFKGNYVRSYFQNNSIASFVGSNQFSGDTYGNNIGSYTHDNNFLGFMNSNRWIGGFNNNTFGDDFSDNIFGSSISNNTVGDDFFGNEIKSDFINNNIDNGFQTNQIGSYFNNNTIGDNFGFGYDAPRGNKIGNNFYDNNVGEYFYNNSIPDNFESNEIGNYFQWNVINTDIKDTIFTLNYGNVTGFTYIATGTSATTSTYYALEPDSTVSVQGFGATFDIDVSGGSVVGLSGASGGRLYEIGDTLTILGTQIGGFVGVVDGFSSDAIGKSGLTGTYPNIFAQGTESGENVTFDVTVTADLVSDIVLTNGGGFYLIGEILTIDGAIFGGTDNITITVDSVYSDNIVINVTGVTPASLFYDHYTKEIFERKLGDKRVSYYDEDDVLNIDSIYISSGYIPVYSDLLSFPITYASFEFYCDGVYSNDGGTTSQTANNVQDLVTLFNNNFRSLGYFFDNNDGTLGLYINPSLKQEYCPNGVYSINVYSD